MSFLLHHRRHFLLTLCATVVASLSSIALLSPPANAKSAFQSAYTLEQTYRSALRMLRVDMGFKVTERDPEAAYVLFEYKSGESGSRVTPGSIEMVPQSSGVQVTIQLPQMPQYHEEVLLGALKKKLQSDYGDPPRRPTPRPDSPRPDAGTDADAAPKEPNEPAD